MTNQEFLIKALNGEIDDNGSSWEAMVHYHIKCPYVDGDNRALCFGELEPQRKLCVDCKQKWLESEVDQ